MADVKKLAPFILKWEERMRENHTGRCLYVGVL